MDLRPNHTLYVNNLNDKLRKEDLKRALYYVFSQYGRIIDIIAMKTPKMRGQAFIIYQSINSATSAFRVLQGFHIFEKPMRIQYAKENSTQVKILLGVTAENQKKRDEDREKRRRRKVAQRAQAAAAATPQIDMEAAETEPPNRVLFISNLPDETTDAMLTMLFSQFSGFKDARRAVGGIGFVEYETEIQASAAKSAYSGFKLTPTHAIAITYAKK